MKYTVHIYPVVRVTVTGVEADSQEAAMKKAEEETDLFAVLGAKGVEYAEDIDCFHVDEEGDTEYEKSRWYDKHYKPL